MQRKLLSCQCVGLPVEVHFINFWVVVFYFSVSMADEDSEVRQACLHRESFGEAADVVADAIHQILDT